MTLTKVLELNMAHDEDWLIADKNTKLSEFDFIRAFGVTVPITTYGESTIQGVKIRRKAAAGVDVWQFQEGTRQLVGVFMEEKSNEFI